MNNNRIESYPYLYAYGFDRRRPLDKIDADAHLAAADSAPSAVISRREYGDIGPDEREHSHEQAEAGRAFIATDSTGAPVRVWWLFPEKGWDSEEARLRVRRAAERLRIGHGDYEPEITVVIDADDVTDEILRVVDLIVRYEQRDGTVDWAQVWARLETWVLPDGTMVTLGDKSGETQAMRHIRAYYDKNQECNCRA